MEAAAILAKYFGAITGLLPLNTGISAGKKRWRPLDPLLSKRTQLQAPASYRNDSVAVEGLTAMRQALIGIKSFHPCRPKSFLFVLAAGILHLMSVKMYYGRAIRGLPSL
ncbi:MAG: hypothetical protein ACLTXL_12665 [Clostridia bacterium]